MEANIMYCQGSRRYKFGRAHAACSKNDMTFIAHSMRDCTQLNQTRQFQNN